MYKEYIILTILVSLYLYRRWKHRPLSDIPGPTSTSWVLGHLEDLLRKDAAEAELLWQEQFGGVARIRAPFGEDQLWISDPKAIYHILQTSCYKYPRPADRREFARMVCDDGVLTMEGDEHKRHRKVMQRAFGVSETKALHPIFQEIAAQLVTKWKEMIVADAIDTEQSSIDMNVASWLSRATLDAIGRAAFDYDCKALDGSYDPLVQSYQDFLKNTSGTNSPAELVMQSCFQYLPESWLAALVPKMPGEMMDQVRDNKRIIHRLARGWIADKARALDVGKGHRDIMTLLVKANNSQDPNMRLSEYEMISQIRTLLLAGHETTSNTMSFMLWELAKHKDVQTRLRNEIETAKAACGSAPWTTDDLERMPYLLAVIKEHLRFHATVHHIWRRSAEDDILPLFEPIKTQSGTLITQVPLPAGTNVVLAFACYNRNKKVWGDDADVFRPERWLEEKEKVSPNIGGYSNLLTFSTGPRVCIGQRFAILEIQTLLVELVSNFEFSMNEKSEMVRRLPCSVMVPAVRGEEAMGVQMPLKVSLAPVN